MGNDPAHLSPQKFEVDIAWHFHWPDWIQMNENRPLLLKKYIDTAHERIALKGGDLNQLRTRIDLRKDLIGRDGKPTVQMYFIAPLTTYNEVKNG